MPSHHHKHPARKSPAEQKQITQDKSERSIEERLDAPYRERHDHDGKTELNSDLHHLARPPVRKQD
ncbi:MAG: hypothetical protein H7144_03430 [Burkholderiales bacterium]|nr:hypothetical protein [Phycisphaerae bacterium]